MASLFKYLRWFLLNLLSWALLTATYVFLLIFISFIQTCYCKTKKCTTNKLKCLTHFLIILWLKLRSSRQEVFWEKVILRNFTKLTGKQLCQGLFFNKVAYKACNFIKKEALAQVFSCEFCETSRNTFSYRTPLVVAFIKFSDSFQKFHRLQMYKFFLTHRFLQN